MDEIEKLVMEHISEKCVEAMEAVAKNPDHKEDIGELNRLFDAEISAHNETKRYAVLYMSRLIENYFEGMLRIIYKSIS